MMALLLSLLLAQEPLALGQVKRIHVDKFSAGEGSEQIRDLLISAVAGTTSSS